MYTLKKMKRISTLDNDIFILDITWYLLIILKSHPISFFNSNNNQVIENICKLTAIIKSY